VDLAEDASRLLFEEFIATVAVPICRWAGLAAGCFVFCSRRAFEPVGLRCSGLCQRSGLDIWYWDRRIDPDAGGESN